MDPHLRSFDVVLMLRQCYGTTFPIDVLDGNGANMGLGSTVCVVAARE